MTRLRRTVLHDEHLALGAKMVAFGGWEMPVSYATGIVAEHLAVRSRAGLFDVSHMGRFTIGGAGAVPFLQYVLTNNVEAPDVEESQYTIIPNKMGGAIDDAYLYRFRENEYLLVVNAANRDRDWNHFQQHLLRFTAVTIRDRTNALAMFALQGPESKSVLEQVITSGQLPEPLRNKLSTVTISGIEVGVSRTGYTGEPLGFELFVEREQARALWTILTEQGATPVGLGARDTLRLEAAFPLHGHEFGQDPKGNEIPIFAAPIAKIAVSFSPLKGDYVGRAALLRQRDAFEKILFRDYSLQADLPRVIQPIAIVGSGVARAGARVLRGDQCVGWVTSGTRVPYWVFAGEGLSSKLTDRHQLRSIALAFIDSDIVIDDWVEVEIHDKRVQAVVVEFHLRSEAPPYARPILQDYIEPPLNLPAGTPPQQVRRLLQKAADNTRWRQRECINLIPSEMTASPMARLLSIMDPAFRYAEHKEIDAFYEADVFYYQGTDFIREVEQLLKEELKKFIGCTEVETRATSGQMANATVFSAMVAYLNRAQPKREPRRMRQVVNYHLIQGGHISSQPMGALKDYVARHPRKERAAVEEFPVLVDNPYKIDVPAALELIDEYRPELIIFGKSMVIHKEPLAEIRAFLDEQGLDPVVMYDMAHVLGLIGPHFQQPFIEGANLVTGSTHKTFFGTQRGVIGSVYDEYEERYELWERIQLRTFPGSVSNHHLGTMLGLLVAAYEMNQFKDDYQPRVITNAKAFARALNENGLNVAGDPAIDFTETHQVIVEVGYAKGPELANRLERNNIICNFQATPDQEGFTASGGLRMGVAEMTRFGMQPKDFADLAVLIAEVVNRDTDVKEQVKALRGKFLDLQYCFKDDEALEILYKLL
jgi:aminomethyltransferase